MTEKGSVRAGLQRWWDADRFHPEAAFCSGGFWTPGVAFRSEQRRRFSLTCPRLLCPRDCLSGSGEGVDCRKTTIPRSDCFPPLSLRPRPPTPSSPNFAHALSRQNGRRLHVTPCRPIAFEPDLLSALLLFYLSPPPPHLCDQSDLRWRRWNR